MNDTERKLVEIIYSHYLSTDVANLSINEISLRAGISRQTFNRYYGHLKEYLTGQKPIHQLLMDDDPKVYELLKKSESLVDRLKGQLESLEVKHKQDLAELDQKYTTTLMNGDITMAAASEIGRTLDKQSIHKDILVKKINSLETMLNFERTKNLSNLDHDGPVLDKVIISPDYDSIYKKFMKSGDVDQLEEHKSELLVETIKKLKKLLSSQSAYLVLYVNRYVESFDTFVRGFSSAEPGLHVIANLPIFSSIELKLLLKNIDSTCPADVYIPFCERESVRLAQRKFLYRDVPEYEFKSADKMDYPKLTDGFRRVCFFQIGQGN